MSVYDLMNEKKKNPNDVVYTPEPLAKLMISMCNIKPTDKVLDPSLGAGVFYNNFPECKKEWCEIAKGKDFFNYNKKVDWVIGNPPYSMWTKWLEHTSNICDKFCYIFGVGNVTIKRLDELKNKGFGITAMKFIKVDWWFMTHLVLVFEKNKPSILEYFCEHCGKRCYRGRTINGIKYSPNECNKTKIKIPYD
jgi:hypothetical protein